MWFRDEPRHSHSSDAEPQAAENCADASTFLLGHHAKGEFCYVEVYSLEKFSGHVHSFKLIVVDEEIRAYCFLCRS